MNERQERLYQFLLEKSHTNKYISKEEICYNLPKFYSREKESSTEHNSRAFSKIRRDVRAINRSDVEKIVVSSKKGYKIANKDEAIEFINKRFKRDLSSLKTNWNLKRKVGLNNQVKMEKEMLKVVKTYVERGD
ncbi:MAG: hypothetical protein ACOX1F_00995 [Erysipelotrichaceae bacterium]|jgi:hypothetical protein